MELVIDANIVLAGLLRNSVTKALIIDPQLTLHAPDQLLTETERRLTTSSRFRRRLNLSNEELGTILSFLFAPITVHAKKHYSRALKQAITIAPHDEDAPCLTLALALDIPLWSNDRGLATQETVDIFTTADVIASLTTS